MNKPSKVKQPNKIRTISCIVFLLIMVSIIILNNKSNRDPAIISGFYFDTYVTIKIYDEITLETQNDIITLLSYYDTILSPNNKDSLVSKVNNNDDIYVNEDYANLLETSLEIASETNGLLDPTILPVYDLYDFSDTSDNMHTNPDTTSINDTLPLVDYASVYIDDMKVVKGNPATKIGFGFIAKGYIADKVRDLLIEKNIKEAVIDLGGNILVVGSKNNKGYNIGIQNPYTKIDQSLFNSYVYESETIDFINSLNIDGGQSYNNLPSTNPALVLNIKNQSMVTSGIYERYYLYDDKVVHHIIDTSTGLPVNNELLSVTIIGPDSTLCDAYSTACFLLGTKKGIEYLDTKKGYHGVFITKRGDILYSSSFPYELLKNN